MEKERGIKENRKLLYLFCSFFTLFLLFSFTLNTWLNTGWWIRTLDNKWSDVQRGLPALLSFDYEGNRMAGLGKYFNHEADERISIAAIDEDTVKKLGYPFKRKYYAELIGKLNKAGVKAIGVDVFIFDSDRDDKVSDQAMVDAVAKAGNVSMLVAVDPHTGEILYPIKGMSEAAKYLSHPHVESHIEGNGEVRRLSLFSSNISYDSLKVKTRCSKDCAQVGLPLLAMATYATYSGKSLLQLQAEYGTEAKLTNFRVPKVRPYHAGRENGKLETNDSVYRHISVLDILDGKLSKDEKAALSGGIVLIGSTALGAYDHYPSPFSASWPGVEIHANAIDNILHKDFLHPVAVWLLLLVSVLLVWLPVVLFKYSIKVISVTSGLVMLSLMLVSMYSMTRLTDMPFLSLLVSMLVPFLFVTVYKAVMEGREKKWIKNTFGQYLSPKVVEIITKDPSKLSLGGEKRDMTAMFCDIAGFTTISEKLTPEQLTAMLNTYLSGLTDVILQQEGVVDKFIGDCIMAFWNAPLDLKNHRTNACLAAVDCLAVNNRLNAEAKDMVVTPHFRIGLNSGPMIVGNMGSRNRFSYTAIGDAVNLASRLEGANKFFNSRIMASEDVFDEAKDQLEARYLGQIRVVGKAIPVKVYEPLTRKGQASPEIAKMLPLYGAGIASFYAGKYAAAAKDFKAAAEARPGDGPSQFYLELAEEYAKAVPKDWDGSFNLTSK